MTPRLASAALGAVGALWLAVTPASAAEPGTTGEAAATGDVVHPIMVGGDTPAGVSAAVTLRSSGPQRWELVVGADDAGADPLVIALPFRREPAEVVAQWHALSPEPLLEVEVVERDEPDARSWRGLFARVEGRRRAHWIERWRGIASSASFGSTWQVREQDGRREAVVYDLDPRMRRCGSEVRLRPRVLRGGREEPLETGRIAGGVIGAMRSNPVSYADSFPLDAEVRWLSRATVASGMPEATRALGDGSLATWWGLEAAVADGALAQVHVMDEVPVHGLTLTLDRGSSPARFVVHTDAGSWRFDAVPGVPFAGEFDAPHLSRCVTVEVERIDPRRELRVAELHAVTALDVVPVDRALKLHVLPILEHHRNRAERESIIRWIASAGPVLLPALEAAIHDEVGPRQQVLVLLTAHIAQGDAVLARVAAAGELDAESLDVWQRVRRELSEEARSTLLAALPSAAAPAPLIRLLAGDDDPRTAQALLALADSPDAVRRAAARDALSRSQGFVSPQLLDLALHRPAERLEWLRAAMTQSRQRPARTGEERSALAMGFLRVVRECDASQLRMLLPMGSGVADATVYAALVELAERHSDVWVRAAAIDAVAAFDDERVAPLEDRLRWLSGLFADPEPTVRITSTEAAARNARYLPMAPGLYTRLRVERWPEARLALLRLLVRAVEANPGSESGTAVEWLATTATHDERERFLSLFRPPESMTDIDAERFLALDAATRGDDTTRRTLVFAVGRSGSARIREWVESLARDSGEGPGTRLGAATVLARTGDDSAGEVLRLLLRDSDAALALRAAELICAWEPASTRAATAAAADDLTPHPAARERLRTCRGLSTSPDEGIPLLPR